MATPALASLSLANPLQMQLAGAWTALGLADVERQAASLQLPRGGGEGALVADASQVQALDSAGAWVLQTLLTRWRAQGQAVSLHGLQPRFTAVMDSVAKHRAGQADQAAGPAPAGRPDPGLLSAALATLGRWVSQHVTQGLAVFSLLGEVAVAGAGWLRHPSRCRWRPVLFNIRTAGLDALPIVGLLAFLMGVVVAYQSADQLRQFGANIFIVDVVGLSMLREFAPLVTAIIVAGRSGSAYTAQIGTMAVTEEIDAMRTLGIPPLDVLVLPKVLAMLVALPLLTFFADVMGVFGGMLMARSQLGIGFEAFADRFIKAVSVTAYLVGLGKAPVFAVIIVVIGCFQGLQTRGGADSVGRQTTRSVVQAIFLVIVADAVFSVLFSALDL